MVLVPWWHAYVDAGQGSIFDHYTDDPGRAEMLGEMGWMVEEAPGPSPFHEQNHATTELGQQEAQLVETLGPGWMEMGLQAAQQQPEDDG